MPEVRVGEWSGIENRRHKRVPLHVAIECRSKEAVIDARAENISTSGLLVRCADPFPQDSEIDIVFRLPGAQEPVRCCARVAHMVPAVFMGLEFVNMPEPPRVEIARYVEEHDPVFKVRE